MSGVLFICQTESGPSAASDTFERASERPPCEQPVGEPERAASGLAKAEATLKSSYWKCAKAKASARLGLSGSDGKPHPPRLPYVTDNERRSASHRWERGIPSARLRAVVTPASAAGVARHHSDVMPHALSWHSRMIATKVDQGPKALLDTDATHATTVLTALDLERELQYLQRLSAKSNGALGSVVAVAAAGAAAAATVALVAAVDATAAAAEGSDADSTGMAATAAAVVAVEGLRAVAAHAAIAAAVSAPELAAAMLVALAHKSGRLGRSGGAGWTSAVVGPRTSLRESMTRLQALAQCNSTWQATFQALWPQEQWPSQLTQESVLWVGSAVPAAADATVAALATVDAPLCGGAERGLANARVWVKKIKVHVDFAARAATDMADEDT
eukprot:CAMPEP_0119333474 /NCGR_PEP_ID=MMETSP1333-20130426/85239_1 /TAXON_ID=418940 /ORGANISM="Scyphosphaera apsteinii, Strain RCC1455" /LENGTH=388 /DNA_ID=CAMNT_0007343551 /DNA_START=216 /DNA_END=1386 /DNA_ORIENTATION=+